jgi:hypothetical protein
VSLLRNGERTVAENCHYDEIMSEMRPYVDGPDGLSKLAEVEMEELCKPSQEFYSCIMNELEVCNGIDHPIVDLLREPIAISGVLLKAVCDDHVDVINRKKACLLKEGSPEMSRYGPNIQLVHNVTGSCQHLFPRPTHHGPGPRRGPYQEFCFSTELRQCVKQIVADQCGDDIADVLNDIAGQVINVLDCDDASSSTSTEGPSMLRKIRLTNRGFMSSFKRIKSFF